MKQLAIFFISLALAIGITALIFNRKQDFFSDNQNSNLRSDLEKYCLEVKVSGHSMEPTLVDKSTVCAYIEEPTVNDLAVLRCKNCGLEEPVIKRVKKIKNNCYWVEGDNLEYSFDSRQFGYLCPDNLEYIWKAEKQSVQYEWQ